MQCVVSQAVCVCVVLCMLCRPRVSVDHPVPTVGTAPFVMKSSLSTVVSPSWSSSAAFLSITCRSDRSFMPGTCCICSCHIQCNICHVVGFTTRGTARAQEYTTARTTKVFPRSTPVPDAFRVVCARFARFHILSTSANAHTRAVCYCECNRVKQPSHTHTRCTPFI